VHGILARERQQITNMKTPRNLGKGDIWYHGRTNR
jgi:hypothetical protein